MPVWNLLDLGRCLNMKPETHNSAAFRSTAQVVMLNLLRMCINQKVSKLLRSAEYHHGKSFVGPTGPREASWAKRRYDTPCVSEKEKEKDENRKRACSRCGCDGRRGRAAEHSLIRKSDITGAKHPNQKEEHTCLLPCHKKCSTCARADLQCALRTTSGGDPRLEMRQIFARSVHRYPPLGQLQHR